MRSNPFIKAVSVLSVAVMALASCDTKEKPIVKPNPEPTPDGNIKELYVAGTAGAKLGEQKLTYKGDDIFNYNGVLSPGELYFTGKDKDDKSIELKKGENNKYTLTGGTNFSAEKKGWYDINIDIGKETCEVTLVAELGDLLTMVGNTPGNYDPIFAAAYFNCTDENPFIYTCSRKYFIDGAGDFFRFCIGTSGETGLLMKELNKETIVCFANNQAAHAAGYKTSADETYDNNVNKEDKGNFVFGKDQNDYTCTVDLVKKTVTFTPITFYPDFVTEMWVAVEDGTWQWVLPSDKTFAKMEKSANGKVFTLNDFETTGGTLFFGLTRNVWRPGIFKGTDDKAFYPLAMENSGDKWAVTAGKYDISIDVSTSAVIITRHDDPLPDGDISALSVAGTAADGLTLTDFVYKGDDVFNYNGVLSAGELYLTGKDGSDLSITLKQGSDGKYTTAGGTNFAIAKKGWYSIDINAEDETYEIRLVAELGDLLTMIGVSVGSWDGIYGAPFRNSVAKPFVYTCTRTFYVESGSGIYKFVVNESSDDGVLLPEAGGTAVTCFADAASIEGGDRNWAWAGPEGDYTCTVDLIEKSVTFTPQAVYPDHITDLWVYNVDKDKQAWNTGFIWTLPAGESFPKMTKNGNTFSYTGDFIEGTLYLVTVPNVWRPAISKATDSDKGVWDGNGSLHWDSMWSIPSAGNYTVTYDVSTSNMTIVKN